MRRILVTSALPYANGSIHLGHLVEYLQTDIWVRFQKMLGHEVHYICADDTHGTPIMLRAEKEGITPDELISRVSIEHKNDFNKFFINFDYYGSTNDQATKEIASDIYIRLKNNAKLISQKTIEQFYDPEKMLFLSDRYVRGTCPKCQSEDQYGDSCEVCGATYRPTELINPISALSGVTPIRKESDHYFFQLSDPRCLNFLEKWVLQPNRLQPEAKNKIKEWFVAGFSDWDISRDSPYFGFEIPDSPGKYFYVWLDAPIGYFGSFKNLCEKKSLDFESYVSPQKSEKEKTELIHFIGKDILYFHALFFPAILHFAGYRTPTQIYAHGFLTINGQKMSKSRGTFITANDYIRSELNPEWLRYYYFSKLNSSLQDIDLNFDELLLKVNGDLIGKFINIASRTSKFINSQFNNTLCSIVNGKLLVEIRNKEAVISQHYDNREFSKALREIMRLADNVNQFIDTEKPWKLKETNSKRLQIVCSTALEAFRLLTLYLKPVLPVTCCKIEQFLNIKSLTWDDINNRLEDGHKIENYTHLMHRADKKCIDKLESTPSSPKPKKDLSINNKKMETKNSTDIYQQNISIADFNRVKLKIARITKAEEVGGADKLLRLHLDLGENITRKVLAGIKLGYKTTDLEGKLTVMVTNLEPRKMKFGISEGMVLAASDDSGGIFLLSPDSGAEPGMEVK